MKKFKYIIALFFMFILLNCNVEMKQANAQNVESTPNIYSYSEENHNNMKYGIWSVKNYNDKTGYSIITVNLTKDELEVKVLQEQYAKLMREKK